MNETSKVKYLAFCVAMAASYGVADVSKQFTVTPSIAQELQDLIVEQDTFLKQINVLPVDELAGEKILGSVGGFTGTRTDTDVTERETKSVLQLGAKDYQLYKTEYDTHIKYRTIDTWAKFKDFQERYQKYVRQAMAMARVKTGWYGLTAAATTDSVAHPNGEDLNKGWFQLLREYNGGAQWFLEGSTDDQIRIGEGGDFENLDSAVFACSQMIDPLFQDDDDLVVLVGRELLAAERARLYAKIAGTPSEKEKILNQLVVKEYGGLPAMTPSGFPSRGLMVTSLKNLSIYYQDSSVRRKVEDNPKRDRVEDYNSLNEGYVIENEEKAAGFEFKNIKIKVGNGWA